MAFIGLDREIVNHWIYQDSEYFKVWFEMLYRARFSTEPHGELIDGEIIVVNYGEFIYGRKKWSDRLRVSEQRLRTLIKKLRAEQMIEVVTEHRKCTLYRIKNYAKFNQQVNQQNNQQNDQSQQGFSGDWQPADQPPLQPASNHQPTTSQPLNNNVVTKKQRSNNNKPSSRQPKTYAEDSSPYRMAKYLYDKIMRYAEGLGKAHLVQDADMQKWADECRKILEIDKRPKKEIMALIDWIAADPFWQQNVLSPKKLREKYADLCIKMAAEGGKNEINGRGPENPYAGIDFGF